jgi:hypothetical protein
MNPGAVSIMQFHFSVVIESQLADQQAAARCRLLADIVAKVFWGGERKFLEPLMRFIDYSVG